MSAYIIVRIKASDPEQLKDYQLAAPPVIEKFGGKYIARGGTVVSLEGPAELRRIVIIEFPDLAAAEAFYNSHEYEEVRKLREGVAEAEFIAVDGVM